MEYIPAKHCHNIKATEITYLMVITSFTPHIEHCLAVAACEMEMAVRGFGPGHMPELEELPGQVRRRRPTGYVVRGRAVQRLESSLCRATNQTTHFVMLDCSTVMFKTQGLKM